MRELRRGNFKQYQVEFKCKTRFSYVTKASRWITFCAIFPYFQIFLVHPSWERDVNNVSTRHLWIRVNLKVVGNVDLEPVQKSFTKLSRKWVLCFYYLTQRSTCKFQYKSLLIYTMHIKFSGCSSTSKDINLYHTPTRLCIPLDM